MPDHRTGKHKPKTPLPTGPTTGDGWKSKSPKPQRRDITQRGTNGGILHKLSRMLWG